MKIAVWLRRLRLPLMLLVFVALAWLLAKDFSGADFQKLLAQADLALLILAGLPSLIALLFKGIRLCWLGEGLGFKLSLWEGIKYQVIAISLAMLTPGRAGEFSKVLLLARHDSRQMGAGTLAVLLERIQDLVVLGLLSLMFCVLHLHNGTLSLALGLMIVLLLGLGAVLLRLASRDASRLHHLIPLRLRGLMGDIPNLQIHRLVLQTLLTGLIWCLEGVAQWLILQSAGFQAPFLPVLGISALMSIASVLSLLPVGLGTVELSALVLYGGSLNVPQAGVLYLVAASRVLSLTPLFGLFGLIALTDKSLLRKVRSSAKSQVDEADLNKPSALDEGQTSRGAESASGPVQAQER